LAAGSQDAECRPTSTSNNASGFAYGAQIGNDFRLGDAAVLGAEVDITGSTGSTDFSALARNLGASDARVKCSRTAVTAGLNFRF
jgi:hypothetical protein